APAALVAAAIALAADYRRTTQLTTLLGVAGVGIVIVGWLHLMAWPHGGAYDSTAARFSVIVGRHGEQILELARRGDGGLAGAVVTTLLSPLDVAGSYVTLVALGISSLLLLTNVTLVGAARQ